VKAKGIAKLFVPAPIPEFLTKCANYVFF